MQFRFEKHALDANRRELWRGSELIEVEPQVFDLLVYLLQNRDRVVSKDDMIASVWGGRIVSDSTLTSRINAARKAIGDNGDRQDLIRTIARKGFRFIGEVQDEQSPAASDPANVGLKPRPMLAVPDRPSIAVLPFANMSGNAEQDHFADGIAEDIITALSRLRSLFVIARNSSFTYKGKAVDVRQVARELGVRYVLEGSIRMAGNRIRVTSQLADAESGKQLWAEKYDHQLVPEDIFDLQDRLTTKVIGAIAPKLERAEIERVRYKPTDSLDAYDYLLRGMTKFYNYSRASNDDAMSLFYKATELDPEFASAYGMTAWCHVLRKAQSWATYRAPEIAEVERVARRATDIGQDDAAALHRGGFALAYVVADMDAGAAFVERAVALNPNLASAWYHSAWIKLFVGEPDVAIERLTHVMRVNPLDPLMFGMQTAMAYGHFFAGRYEEASSWADQALQGRPDFHLALRIAAASHVFSGRRTAAENALARLRSIDPALRIAHLSELMPLRRLQDKLHHADALRQVGLPE